MDLKISPQIFEKFPQYKTGVLILTGINNRLQSKDPFGILKQAISNIKNKLPQDLTELTSIKFWRDHLNQTDIDPDQYPVSIQSMLNRIQAGKGIPSINPVVDLYNSVSIQEMIPMGGYDLDKCQQDLEIRYSQTTDTFTPLLKETAIPVKSNEIVFSENNNILCAKWVWKQNNLHKLTINTRNIIIRIEGIEHSKEKISKIIENLGKLITKFCGGKFKTLVLNKKTPQVNLDLFIKDIKINKLSDKEIAINNILNRGTVDVIVRDDLEAKLKSGKKLNIKFGIDPTGASLHIGHMVVIKKLAEFQKLGHNIQLLFGNFTGQIGDPTGKSEVRNKKTQSELEKNAETYQKQVSKILDINKIETVWNADWLGKLSFSDVIHLSSKFTVSQMLERDMNKERIKNKQAIYVHEFLYPLMQGYDSVALKSDVELGGTEQTFNLLAGRTLQKAYGQTPQNIITVPILEGLDGHIKMGKSEGNFVGVIETPNEQFGKLMSIPDNLIIKYFELATNISLKEIEKIQKDIASGMNPRDAKIKMAKEVISIYHSETEAQQAEISFMNVFQKKKLPDQMPEIKITSGQKLINILIESNQTPSKGEARRLFTQNAISFNDKKITDINFIITVSGICKIGKRRFIKININ